MVVTLSGHYSWILILPSLFICRVESRQSNGVETRRHQDSSSHGYQSSGSHGNPDTNYGVYQPIINIEMPDTQTTSCNDDEKETLNQLQNRFKRQEEKLDRILSILTIQLCPCDPSKTEDSVHSTSISSYDVISDSFVDSSSSITSDDSFDDDSSDYQWQYLINSVYNNSINENTTSNSINDNSANLDSTSEPGNNSPYEFNNISNPGYDISNDESSTSSTVYDASPGNGTLYSDFGSNLLNETDLGEVLNNTESENLISTSMSWPNTSSNLSTDASFTVPTRPSPDLVTDMPINATSVNTSSNTSEVPPGSVNTVTLGNLGSVNESLSTASDEATSGESQGESPFNSDVEYSSEYSFSSKPNSEESYDYPYQDMAENITESRPTDNYESGELLTDSHSSDPTEMTSVLQPNETSSKATFDGTTVTPPAPMATSTSNSGLDTTNSSYTTTNAGYIGKHPSVPSDNSSIPSSTTTADIATFPDGTSTISNTISIKPTSNYSLSSSSPNLKSARYSTETTTSSNTITSSTSSTTLPSLPTPVNQTSNIGNTLAPFDATATGNGGEKTTSNVDVSDGIATSAGVKSPLNITDEFVGNDTDEFVGNTANGFVGNMADEIVDAIADFESSEKTKKDGSEFNNAINGNDQYDTTTMATTDADNDDVTSSKSTTDSLQTTLSIPNDLNDKKPQLSEEIQEIDLKDDILERTDATQMVETDDKGARIAEDAQEHSDDDRDVIEKANGAVSNDGVIDILDADKATHQSRDHNSHHRNFNSLLSSSGHSSSLHSSAHHVSLAELLSISSEKDADINTVSPVPPGTTAASNNDVNTTGAPLVSTLSVVGSITPDSGYGMSTTKDYLSTLPIATYTSTEDTYDVTKVKKDVDTTTEGTTGNQSDQPTTGSPSATNDDNRIMESDNQSGKSRTGSDLVSDRDYESDSNRNFKSPPNDEGLESPTIYTPSTDYYSNYYYYYNTDVPLDTTTSSDSAGLTTTDVTTKSTSKVTTPLDSETTEAIDITNTSTNKPTNKTPNELLKNSTDTTTDEYYYYYDPDDYNFYGDFDGSQCPPASQLSTAPRDCDDIGLAQETVISGEYCIYPLQNQRQSVGIRVYCDLETAGGGWTVIQRHGTVSDFSKTWDEYKDGFGDLSADFWLGNDNIHRLTSQDEYELRIDLEDYSGNTGYAKYDSFHVGNEEEAYQLEVGKYSGNTGDSFRWHNHHAFSTWDTDNDVYKEGNCAQIYQAGWWYTSCLSSNLNGLHLPASTRSMGIVWTRFQKGVNLNSASMKIRRVNFQRSHASPIAFERRFFEEQPETNLDTVHSGHDDDGSQDANQGPVDEGLEEGEMEDLKPKMKKSKLDKIFKNFYNKWRR